MYTPTHFLEADLTQLDWLAAHDSFGTLISLIDGELFATHLPVLYRREQERVTLTGHWARPNPQWRTIAGQQSLFIFHGPHTYVSPRWYARPNDNVPTWNYATAHIYGNVRVIDEPQQLAGIVSQLAAKYEAAAPAPWRFEASTGPRMLRGIVGFELVADRIQVKFKLNQNHPAENVVGVIAALTAAPTDDSRAIAALMQTALSKRA
ncbi:MAG TPA: FMN-binding negative transcriptional regulator [Steroidobacteraceae bacterium]